MNDNDMRDLFGEMREEPLPAESLARVRMAVSESVAARRRTFGLRWKVTVLLAVAGALGVVMWQQRTVAPVQMPVVQVPEVAVQQAAPEVAAPEPVVHKTVRAVAKPARHVEAPAIVSPDTGGATEIRIESAEEPDVVIVLLGG